MRTTYGLIALCLTLLLAGCGKNESSPAASTPATPDGAPALTKVTLQLNWFPETEHGGYYQAQLAGLYKAQGLDVEILKGGPSTPVEQQVAAERIDFGIVNADKILATRVEQLKLVGLLAPFQTSPRCIIVRDDSPVQSLADLGKLDTLIANNTKPFVMFLQHTYDLETLKIIPYKGGMATFLANPGYGIQGYLTSEPLTIAQKGVKNRSLLLADAGYNPYTSVLVTSEAMLKAHPDVVRKLVVASQQGWVAYLADPGVANQEIKRLNPELENEVLAYGANELKKLMLTDQVKAHGFGSMTAERWSTLRDQLIKCEVIKDYPEPIATAYTNDYFDPSVK